MRLFKTLHTCSEYIMEPGVDLPDPYPSVVVTRWNGHVVTFRVGQRVQVNLSPSRFNTRASMYNFLWGTIIMIGPGEDPKIEIILDTPAPALHDHTLMLDRLKIRAQYLMPEQRTRRQ